MTKYWTVWVAALGLAAQSEAAVVEVNLTAPLSSAVYSVQAVDAQTLELSVAAPSFVVAEGDTVRVKWTFSGGETFQLLPDPHIGLRGWLTRSDPTGQQYSVSFIPSWAFLDVNGNHILTGSEQRQGQTGGDLSSGGLTVANAATLEIAGLQMELSDIVDISTITNVSGSLPVEFSGARFSIENALFGLPFDDAPPDGQAPEPATLALTGAALAGMVATRRRRNSADTA